MWNILVWKSLLVAVAGIIVLTVVLSHVLPMSGCNSDSSNGVSIVHMGASK